MNMALAIGCYVAVLCAASAAWQFGPPRTQGSRFRPVATVAALLVIGIPSLLQLTMAPGLLEALERQGAGAAAAQPWRIVTALVVQDGGWPAAITNLAALAWIGSMAEHAWGTRRWLVIALGTGIGAQLWGFLVQPVGAGNSVVVFGLAASLLVRAWIGTHRTARMASVVGLAASAVLLVGGDLHGGAAAIGSVIAMFLLRPKAQPHTRNQEQHR
ncbi:rhomboid family intramembrane serine protease [Paeniglutamicibacter psychrophenolicus]|uniref:Membrane associated rhomboid family serine protease n=1 Tax=Paeniglutamicibacter psychrophenolicus TaxID=257454 RepID=A0ABS4WE98_9MICC|nr:rhomboid family intramembrane serine protease [Paeniglutamicibacter psychrophenolicus]MBP2374522.1 membrane associated rhomboid family serine protease [Paeniglutamicibacter psychrophenolicus]